jgi:hypothetical protein
MGDPNACDGHADFGTGYGCFMAQMIAAWRRAWSRSPLSGTRADFPVGIVSLAGGTSEGHSGAMPAFRNAQTAGGVFESAEHNPCLQQPITDRTAAQLDSRLPHGCVGAAEIDYRRCGGRAQAVFCRTSTSPTRSSHKRLMRASPLARFRAALAR